MKLSITIGLAVLACMLLASSAASAGTCPGLGWANDCNLIINIGNGGSVSASVTAAQPYDGIEDQYVGVFNNATDGFVLNSLGLSGTNIFGFDGDGAFGGGSSCLINLGAPYACGTGGYYNGPGNYFIVSNSDNGVVYFTGGLGGNGQVAYFSLEEPASPGAITGIVPNAGVPEPASLLLVGSGLLGFLKRRRA